MRVLHEHRALEGYRKTHTFQIEARDRIINGDSDSMLVTVRHPSVITVGRGGTAEDVLADAHVLSKRGIEVVEVERGGKVTYHGPGQSVVYPLFNLRNFGKDIHRFIRSLENVLIGTLAEFSLDAYRGTDTGVFVNKKKIGSIGIAVKRWVTWHGISLNVYRDTCFSLISPCGLSPGSMTSMEEEGAKPDMTSVEEELVESFRREFGIEIVSQQSNIT